jgi:hypothetical protein
MPVVCQLLWWRRQDMIPVGSGGVLNYPLSFCERNLLYLEQLYCVCKEANVKANEGCMYKIDTLQFEAYSPILVQYILLTL